jgi:hypothetical protein
MPDRPDDPDLEALRRAGRVAPERPATEAVTLRQGRDLSPDRPGDRDAAEDPEREPSDISPDDFDAGPDEGPAVDPQREATDRSPDDLDADPEDATLEDWETADASRPTLPDETEDGLSDQDEEVRRQAEDPVSIRRSRRG